MYLYNISLILGDDVEPILRKRTLERIEVFAEDLKADFPALPEAHALSALVCPSNTTGGKSNRDSREACPPSASELQHALHLCIRNPEVVRSTSISRFLWDTDDDDGETVDTEEGGTRSAMDFILQPLETMAEYIPCRRLFFHDVFLRQGETVIWRFSVSGGYDISFCLLFRELGENVDPKNAAAFSIVESISKEKLTESMNSGISDTARSDTVVAVDAKRVVTLQDTRGQASFSEGSYTPQRAGFVRLIFNNHYSRINGKHITYVVQVVSEDVLQAAFQAADDTQQTQNRQHSNAYRRLLSANRIVSIVVDGPWRDPNVGAPTDLTTDPLRLSNQFCVMDVQAEEDGMLYNLSPCDDSTRKLFGNQTEDPRISTQSEDGLVRRYVESGTDHTDVVLTQRSETANNFAEGDVVLDSTFSGEKKITESKEPHANWLSSAIEAVSRTYDPMNNVSSNVTTNTVVAPANRVLGVTTGIPINSNALFTASSALLQLVWRGYSQFPKGVGETPQQTTSNTLMLPPTGDSGAGNMADLLQIARYVDELEDKNAILSAERDQAKAIGIRDGLSLKMAREDVISVEEMLAVQEQQTQEWRSRSEELEKELAAVKEATTSRLVANTSCQDNEQAQFSVDKGVWGSTREGVSRQLTEAHIRLEEEITRSETEKKRAQALDTDVDRLTERIIELETTLSQRDKQYDECNQHDKVSNTAGVMNKGDIRDYKSRVSELEAQLQVSECQSRIEVSRMRQQLRQNSAVVALAKTESAECRMMLAAYREKLEKLKAQKKVLVNELRSLRDLGIYDGRITVDHAEPIQEAKTFSDKCKQLDHVQSGSVSPTRGRPLAQPGTVLPSQSPSASELPEQNMQETGINFSLLELIDSQDDVVATGVDANVDVIDFTNDNTLTNVHNQDDMHVAPGVMTDSADIAMLRHARLRQHTVSLILKENPGNVALRELLQQLIADVKNLQEKVESQGCLVDQNEA